MKEEEEEDETVRRRGGETMRESCQYAETSPALFIILSPSLSPSVSVHILYFTYINNNNINNNNNMDYMLIIIIIVAHLHCVGAFAFESGLYLHRRCCFCICIVVLRLCFLLMHFFLLCTICKVFWKCSQSVTSRRPHLSIPLRSSFLSALFCFTIIIQFLLQIKTVTTE